VGVGVACAEDRKEGGEVCLCSPERVWSFRVPRMHAHTRGLVLMAVFAAWL
jgi:hypothetical protein